LIIHRKSCRSDISVAAQSIETPAHINDTAIYAFRLVPAQATHDRTHMCGGRTAPAQGAAPACRNAGSANHHPLLTAFGTLRYVV
jgi:hypothetical protein